MKKKEEEKLKTEVITNCVNSTLALSPINRLVDKEKVGTGDASLAFFRTLYGSVLPTYQVNTEK